MKTKDAIRHFGTQVKTAAALGIDQSTVSRWGEYPPHLQQLRIQYLTLGQLMAEPDALVGPSRLVKDEQACN